MRGAPTGSRAWPARHGGDGRQQHRARALEGWSGGLDKTHSAWSQKRANRELRPHVFAGTGCTTYDAARAAPSILRASRRRVSPDRSLAARWGRPGKLAERPQRGASPPAVAKHGDADTPRTLAAQATAQYHLDRRDLLVGRRLSEGASSVVYLGRHKNEFVAIKVLRAQRLAPRDYDAYLAEVEIINKLNHPHVLRFVGVCWAQPNATLVTEWMAGGSLFDMLHAHEKSEDGPPQPRPLSLLRTLRLSEQIASAVAHVHAHGVVHRDIKSCNILLDRERQIVKIADFGLSRHLATHDKSMTVATGTFRWMAPELLSGNGKYGTAVDIYSFAVVIYEMLSGLLPFPLLSPVEAAVRVVRDNLRPDLPDSVPDELRVLVERCWDVAAAKRPAACELETSLGRWRRAAEEGELATPVAIDEATPDHKRTPSDTSMLRSLSAAILAQTDDEVDSTSASGVVPVPQTPPPARKQGLLAGIRGMMCCAQAGGSQ